MFQTLDNRTQLAIAIMATEKVYAHWLDNWDSNPNHIYDSDKYGLHITPHNLNFYLWRKGSNCTFANILMQPQQQGHCYISVENYFRGIARDTLELNNPNTTFDDYLKLANNFPEQAVNLMVQGLFKCFETVGLLNEFSYYVGVATNLLDLKE
jgi:hypothetical protein